MKYLFNYSVLFVLFLFGFLPIHSLIAQYGNEWVQYGKPYYKFHTPSEDIYMNWAYVYRRDMVYVLSYSTIKASGFPIDTTDPRHIQVFTDGKETAIEIIGEDDGKFDTGDYIRIFSEHNDTRMDEPLYKRKEDIPINITFHSSQKAHFLSYTTDGTLGKRVEKVKLADTGQTAQVSHNNHLSSMYLRSSVETNNAWFSSTLQYGFDNVSYGAVYPVNLLKSRFNIQSIGSGGGAYTSYKNEARLEYWKYGTSLQSHFNEGKGFVGVVTQVGNTRTHEFKLEGITNPQVRVKVRVMGLLNTPHHIKVTAEDGSGNSIHLGDLNFNNYEIATLENTFNSLNISKLSPDLKIKIVALQVNTSATGVAQREDWAPIETEIFYEQDFNLSGTFWGEKYYGMVHGISTVSGPAWYSANNKVDKFFYLKPNPTGTSKVELENLPAGAILYDITDPNTVKIIEPTRTIGTKKVFLIPNTTSSRKLYVSNHSHAVGKVYTERTYQPVNPNATYLIVYNGLREENATYFDIPSWRTLPIEKYTSSVQEYANYRSSPEGGNYTVQMSDIEDLYDLFSYGQRTILAMRNFAKYMLEKGAKPKALFLIGKGLEYTAGGEIHWDDLPPFAYNVRWSSKPALVPSLGSPASDNEITAGLAGYPEHVPAIPTGRLSVAHYAKTEVLDYLDKVKAHDAMGYDTPWAKDILHLSGGTTAAEHTQFQSYVNHYTQLAKDDYMGCNVETINKLTTNAREYVDIREQINKGKLLVTIYGHSSPSGSSFNIGEPQTPSYGFVNKGKYPMIIMNGCNAGRIFENEYRYGFGSRAKQYYTIGEKWTLTKDKGAVLFWAHAQLGYTSFLYTHTANFYETLSDKKFINKTVGEIIQETCRKSMQRSGQSPIMVANVQQFILQGDPALRLFKENKPDYYIDDTRISLFESNGKPVVAQAKRISLKIDVSNFGISDLNEVEIQVQRTLPNGTNITYPIQKFAPISSRKTINFGIEQEDNVTKFAAGINQFTITIDPNNKHDEVKEDNNTANFSYDFPKTELVVVYPIPYSIETRDTVHLITQRTDDDNNSPETYIFELDTTANFNSSLMRSVTKVSSKMPNWRLGLPLKKDNTVWYWRVRNQNADPNNPVSWVLSSFTYKPTVTINIGNIIVDNITGWTQKDKNQFVENQFDGMTAEEVSIDSLLMFISTTSATMTSLPIGRAKSWHHISWEFDNRFDSLSWQIDVLGIKSDNTENILFSDLKDSGIGLDISSVSTILYPYLRIRLTYKGMNVPIEEGFPLEKLTVFYETVPELIIIPKDDQQKEQEVTRGESASVGINVGNVSNTNTEDELTTKTTITNKETGENIVIYDTISAPQAGDSTLVNIEFPTDEFEGEYEVVIIVNPPNEGNDSGTDGNNSSGGTQPTYNPLWEPEQNSNNNIFTFNLNVKSDRINPVLDVAIDGRYILDGDIVAPNPVIAVTLDDNGQKNKLIDAPSHLVMELSRCETCLMESIALEKSDSVSWSISENNNRLSLDYLPKDLPDGLYTLKVQGTDASGNNAGKNPYQISFQVVNKTAISHFYPYPNPVIDKTQFVFTITGQVPEDLRIRIMTVSGKVVRTITQEELGNLHVGHNISEFMWDGTDEYGEKLANGVYLYRVDIKSSSNFGVWNTAGDKFFKKGYGKIYLLR